VAKVVNRSSTAYCFKLAEPGESPALWSSSAGSRLESWPTLVDDDMWVSGMLSCGERLFRWLPGFGICVFWAHVLAASAAALARLVEMALQAISTRKNTSA
jgi:hypothetical protein